MGHEIVSKTCIMHMCPSNLLWAPPDFINGISMEWQWHHDQCNTLPEVGHTYSTAQLKLDTHFGLLVIVHRFYLSHSSMLMCYLCVALVVSQIWLTINRIWHLLECFTNLDPYGSPYQFLRRYASSGLDTRNTWFHHKQFLSIRI